jgi:hypothetical protein
MCVSECVKDLNGRHIVSRGCEHGGSALKEGRPHALAHLHRGSAFSVCTSLPEFHCYPQSRTASS